MSFKHSNSEFFEYCKLKFARSLSPHKSFFNIKLNFLSHFINLHSLFISKGLLIFACVFGFWQGRGAKQSCKPGKHESITLFS